MKSMTGFGRSDYRDEEIELSVEIKTINHRFRDFFLKLPRMMNPVEEKIRKTICEKIARGRIEVFIKYNELGVTSKSIVLNKDLAMNYIGILNRIKSLDSMISDEIDLGLVAKFPDVVILEEERVDSDTLWGKLEPVLLKTLEQVVESRSREGDNMEADIAGHCAVIVEKVEAIEALAPEMLTKYQQDLKARVIAYTESVELDEQRLLTEVAVMSDKLSIDEELARLKSHTGRLQTILTEKDEPVGRKLDFLVQELNREINTIGSKSSNIDIANLVVDVKSEIEKIREQIQNIE